MLKPITHRSDPDARLPSFAIHLIPEAFDVVHRIYYEDCIFAHVSCNGGEESRAGGLFLKTICLAKRDSS
jgi:hypothetical protein